MPAPLPEKVGFGPCPNRYCTTSAPVLFRLSSGARKLTYKCDRCDTSGYAEPGGTGYADMQAAITEKPTPDPGNKPAPPATPTPKPARQEPGGFNLDQLT